MATTKGITPKNTDLEAEILKAAGTGTPPPVNQQDIKDQAEQIGDKANKTVGETEPTKDLAADISIGEAAGYLIAGKDPEYLQFLEWKRQQEAAAKAPVSNMPDNPPSLFGKPAELTDYDKRKQEAEAAAMKAYADIMNKSETQPTDQINANAADALHAERTHVYGLGYVVARRAGIEQVFTAQSWKLLGGRNNKDGYSEVVVAPPEVANLKKA